MAGRGCSRSTSKRRGIDDEPWGDATRAAGRAPSPRGFATICRMLTYPIRVGTHFNTRLRADPGARMGGAFDPALAER